MSTPIQAWYFSAADRRLGYEDGREIALGVTHEVGGDIALCKRGLHASVKPLDALQYAPGPIIWRVELSGNVLTGDDKRCATRRAYVAGGVDVTDTLRLFARRCALDVAHLWDMPEILRRYLETGDESIRAAARASARDAARDAARASAWAAARDAQNTRLESMLLAAIGEAA